jgi:hypothetical protein
VGIAVKLLGNHHPSSLRPVREGPIEQARRQLLLNGGALRRYTMRVASPGKLAGTPTRKDPRMNVEPRLAIEIVSDVV